MGFLLSIWWENTMSKQWEIGLVEFHDTAAKEIVGPFDSRDAALEESSKRNKAIKCLHPGRGKWGWMFAYWKEMTRSKDCKVSTPESK